MYRKAQRIEEDGAYILRAADSSKKERDEARLQIKSLVANARKDFMGQSEEPGMKKIRQKRYKKFDVNMWLDYIGIPNRVDLKVIAYDGADAITKAIQMVGKRRVTSVTATQTSWPLK